MKQKKVLALYDEYNKKKKEEEEKELNFKFNDNVNLINDFKYESICNMKNINK